MTPASSLVGFVRTFDDELAERTAGAILDPLTRSQLRRALMDLSARIDDVLAELDSAGSLAAANWAAAVDRATRL